MHGQFRYRLSKDEYVVGLSALMNELGRQDEGRTRRLVEQLAIFGLVLAAITVAFPDALVGLLVATLLLAVFMGALRARWLRGATGQSYDPAVADHEVEITGDGIFDRSPLRERRWSWSAVRSIHDLKQAVVLELAGWDMLVMPDRLWSNGEERSAFLQDILRFATDVRPAAVVGRKLAPVGTHDLLTLGALAAAVDVFALASFAVPTLRGWVPAIGDAAFVGIFAAMLLAGVALAYVAYRAARRTLMRLQDSWPAAAIGIAQALIWAVPVYMLIAYMGWI